MKYRVFRVRPNYWSVALDDSQGRRATMDFYSGPAAVSAAFSERMRKRLQNIWRWKFPHADLV